MATDKRLWFKVDVGYLHNPKINELVDEHPRAIVLHLACIAYSKQHGTNGRVPMRLAMRLACASQCDLDACMDLGIIRMDGEAHLLVHDYVSHQGSAERDQTRSDNGRRAAEARWKREKDDAQRNAAGNAKRIANGNAEREEKRREETCSSTDVESEFDAWWKVYPRKVGKGQAVKAYRAAAKKVSPTTLLDALTTQVPSLTARGAEYCPYPATWLNGERWDDEPATNVHQMPSASDEGASWMSGGA